MISTSSACAATAVEQTIDSPPLVFASAETNDLYQVASESLGIAPARYDTALEAVDAAQQGDGVLILADGYPETTTQVPAEVFDLAAEKNLRLYIEFPADGVAGLSFGPPAANTLKRLVVHQEDALAGLDHHAILDSHEGVFAPVTQGIADDRQLLTLARVAGYDDACFGYTGGAAPVPALFMHTVPDIGLEIMIAGFHDDTTTSTTRKEPHPNAGFSIQREP